MTAARFIERAQFGYGKSGKVLGVKHDLFRPTAPLTPALAEQNWLRATPFVPSATPDASFRRPSKYGDPIAFGLFDVRGIGPAAVRVGDYITGPSGTYFVASMESYAIPMLATCTATVTISRPAGNTAAGVGPYGGRKTSTDTPLLRQWPASVLAGGRMEAPRADLPGDTPLKGYTVLVPAWPGLIFETSDRLTDDQGRAMVLDQAELTPLGWRLLASMASA